MPGSLPTGSRPAHPAVYSDALEARGGDEAVLRLARIVSRSCDQISGQIANFMSPKTSNALPRAVANLLRLASADLDDARLLLRSRQTRNAAKLLSAAVASVVRAVVASEQGWLGNPGGALDDVPEANPVRPELAAASALAVPPPNDPVRPDGSQASEPPASRVSHALERIASTLKTVAQAFEVKIAGTGPAGRTAPIRPKPPPEPERPQRPARPRSVGHTRDRRGSPSPEPAPESSPRSPDVKAKPSRRLVPPQIVGKGARKSAPASSSNPGVRRPPRPADAELPRQASPTGARIVGRAEPQQRQTAPASSASVPIATRSTGANESPPPRRQTPDMASTAFWSLMDHWNVPDLAALELIGHMGGLTKQGTRPRFRVKGEEAQLFRLLLEIDTSLKPFGVAPDDWLRKPIAEKPFRGATPLEHIGRHHRDGAQAVIRRIMQVSLLGSV
jgi:hypothetical protein